MFLHVKGMKIYNLKLFNIFHDDAMLLKQHCSAVVIHHSKWVCSQTMNEQIT